MTATKHLSWILLTGLYSLMVVKFQGIECSGRLFIQLNEYEDFQGRDINGECCDKDVQTNTCKPCDHYISVCLTDNRNHGQSPCIANISTEPVNDTDTVVFGNYSGPGGGFFILNFSVPTRNLELIFSYYDEDKFDSPPGGTVLLERTNYAIHVVPPDHFTLNPELTNGSIPTNRSRLSFDYNLQCDEHYYGKCDLYCFPDPVRYTCNNYGRIQCNPGWSGTNCTSFDFCSNVTCQNGGKCQASTTNFNCVCPNNNYTGRFCETDTTKAIHTAAAVTTPTTSTTFKMTVSPHAEERKSKPSSENKAPMIPGVTVGIIAALAAAGGGLAYNTTIHGWSGTNYTSFDFCSNVTCQNGGKCQASTTNFNCVCPNNNYTGRFCETDATKAIHTAAAVTTPTTSTTFKMTVSPHAEERKSKPSSENKAPMIAGVTVGTIAALAAAGGGLAYNTTIHGWSGTNSTSFDFCSNVTCQNGGKCQASTTNFNCVCPNNNYTGRFCETDATKAIHTAAAVTTPTTSTTFKMTVSPHAEERKSKPSSENKAPMIAGVTVGIIAALAAAGGGLAYYMMRQKRKVANLVDVEKETDNQKEKTTEPKDANSNEHGDNNREQNEETIDNKVVEDEPKDNVIPMVTTN